MRKLTNFGENLRLMRKTKSLTQVEMSKKLNVTQGAYAKWENGRTEPNLENVVKLAKLFKTTTDFLLGVTDD
ncbi:helix-turn-helix transcriptional regulator [Streptococcus agalactiae]|uniref:helix-turn-helix domain-containing protein n=1 Tax=Streptococcus agalactiae TaxID=1311 RepID=UPI0024BF66E9|nr:helix-turn-helix transcriptional regulator [Streptococcus agalactiae]MCC9842351.1 helix-turn-helix transcriptional regulator [Streptococcus agalactiae]HEN4709625.1 helix-turn-helix transcriptional regulator [Streptococcus agalactiae]